MKRREFLETTITGAGSAALGGLLPVHSSNANESPTRIQPKTPLSTDPCAIVRLTEQIECSRIGLGTGVHGGMRACNMTRMDRKEALDVFRFAYDSGIRLFDLADLYGTHDLCREALAGKPRDSYTIFSKIWCHPGALPENERPTADVLIERFLKELDTDYIDLIQIHCMMDDQWDKKFAHQFEPLEKLKEKGLIRAHGVSIHALSALKKAAVHPWVDALHTRLNTANTRMEGSIEENVEAINTAHQNGKGVIIMKVLGEGAIQDPLERKRSTDFVTRLPSKDVMVVGFEKRQHVTEFLTNVAETLNAMETEMNASK
ncbi:MAG: aldo/keto reductase [Planctomycetia bacterium]|nr:aldo/keto reductase [Planctomycetia bacterium]